jgi:small subunit ribosomal protein S20
MPIIKSAIKAMKQNATARERNRVTKADFRAKVKVVRKDITDGGKGVEKILASAIQSIDKAAKKGVIHKKAANRRKSRLMLAANKANGKAVVIKTVKIKSDKPIPKATAKKKTTVKSTTKKTTTKKKEA